MHKPTKQEVLLGPSLDGVDTESLIGFRVVTNKLLIDAQIR